MKLLQMFTSAGAPQGYFDPIRELKYDIIKDVSRGKSEWQVFVSDSAELYEFLSPLIASKEDALKELERIVAELRAEGAGGAPTAPLNWFLGLPPKDGLWRPTTWQQLSDLKRFGLAAYKSDLGVFVDEDGCELRTGLYGFAHLPIVVTNPK